MTLFISFYFKFLKTSSFKTKSKYYIKLHYVYLNNFATPFKNIRHCLGHWK